MGVTPGPPGSGGLCGSGLGHLLDRRAYGLGAVDAVQLLGAQQVFEGEPDAREQGEPGEEDLRVGGWGGQRGEGGVGGEPAYDRAAERRVHGGGLAVRVHVAVPGQQCPPHTAGLGGEGVEGAQDVQQGFCGGQSGVHVDRRHVGGRPAVLLTQQGRDAVGAMGRGELDAERGGEAALVGHGGDAVGEPAAGRLLPAVPVVAGFPGGDRPGAVGLRAHRHLPGDPVQQTALGVGGLDDVDGLGPQVDGTVDVGDPAGAQQRQQRAEAEVGGDAGWVAQGQGEGRGVVVPGVGEIRVGTFLQIGETLRPADDHRPPLGLDHLDLDRLLPRHLHHLGVPGGPPPHPVRPQGLHSRPGTPQPLPVQVLVVGHGVGDGPGDRARVAEVADARDARDGEADDVELRAGEVDLLVDAGILDESVRVTGDERVPGDGPLPAHQPAVAAGGARPVRGEQARAWPGGPRRGCGCRARRPAGSTAPSAPGRVRSS